MSKRTDSRTQTARSLVAAIKLHAEEIDQRFAGQFAKHLTDAQRKQLGSPSIMLTAVALAMEASSQALVTATDAHEAELADDEAPRRHRDEATSSLVELLVRIRKTVDSAYGSPGLAAIGFAGRTLTDAPGVQSQARQVAQNLEAGRLADVTPVDEAVTVNPKAWIKSLKSLGAKLDGALDDVARETREAQATLTVKNTALEHHDHTSGRGSDFVWGLLRAVDMDDAAEKLIPTHRRATLASEPAPAPAANEPPKT